MKIIDITRTITSDVLLAHLTRNLNTLFREQRKMAIDFRIENVNGAVEITQPEMYEGFLFRISIHGHELWITRSEHYVDDVNSLTLESLLNELFEGLSGEMGIKITLEG
jgi:hypothetical protein